MEFIFHMGAGKTGTSSIQKTLLYNDELLKKKGIWYLGLMLERGVKLYDWQKQTTVVDFFYEKDKEEREKELEDVLFKTIDEAKKFNYKKLIWSNESLLGTKESLIPVFKKLKEVGVDVKLLYYVREPISWAISAYIQWGIKHKTYKGKKIFPFREFINFRKPLFYKHIELIYKEMPDNLYIRNMHNSNDVVKDFLQFINFEDIDKIKIIKDNEKPSDNELLFRAIFNSKFENDILPQHFDNLIKNKMTLSKFEKDSEDILKTLLPDRKDLENLRNDIVDDVSKINELLEKNNQPLLDINVKEKNIDLNNNIIIASLIDIVTSQSKEIQELKIALKELQRKLNTN